jgi:hypothetical protein
MDCLLQQKCKKAQWWNRSWAEVLPMAEMPPKKEAAKAAKEGASPEPFSPSKHSHTNFFSIDGFQVEDDTPPEKRLKSNDPGDGGAASEAQGVGGHDLGANNGASDLLHCRSKMVGSTRTLTGQPSVMSKWQMLV